MNLVVDAIKSVQIQTIPDLECIVVDDYSTDGTKEVVLEICKSDPRVKYHVNERSKGAQGARNTGILKSKGKWICFLDSDDVLVSNSIEIRLAAASNYDNPSVALVYGDFSNVSFKIINGSARSWMISNMALCSFSAMLIDKKLVFDNYLLDESLPAWQDDDLVFEIALRNDVLHCGSVVAIFAPKKRNDNISASRAKVNLGLYLILKKRKCYIIKERGIARLLFWYMRLFTNFLEQVYSSNKLSNSFLIKKILNRVIKQLKRVWEKKFDVIYT